jgi:hypothetical protein
MLFLEEMGEELEEVGDHPGLEIRLMGMIIMLLDLQEEH